MSGLEGLGIAANVMAVITFALDTVKLCKTILDTGSADPNLDENAKNTRKTSDNLQTMLSKQRPNPTEAETRLRDLAAKCVQCARDVEKMVEDISPKKDGIFDAMKSAARTLRRKDQLEKLKDQLEAWKNTMDSAMIVQILNECIASGELHRTAYNNLSLEQKTLIATCEQRSKAVEDLIRHVPSHVTAEHVETRQSLTQRAELFETRNQEKQAYEKLLQSLKYSRMNERANSVPTRHVKTLEWIFGTTENENFERDDMEADTDSDGTRSSFNSKRDPMILSADGHSAYQEWKDKAMEHAERVKREAGLLEWLRHNDHQLYWINGKPGSGKSTLMKFIATDERTKTVLRDWDPKPSIISHFLWKPGSPLQQSLQGLLCSLLYQILSEDADVAHNFIRNSPKLQRKNEESDWDMEDLEKLLFQAIRFSTRAYLILLDGLDELSKPYGGMGRLFGLLDKLVAEKRVKVCVSSRPERLFMDRLGSNPKLQMQDCTYGDILRYTTDVLESIKGPFEDYVLPIIAEEICARAEGVFIWVYVVLQNVKTGIEEFNEPWKDVYDRVIKLPRDLMNLYKDMWSRLDGSNKKYIKKAARYFQLVSYFERKTELRNCNIITLALSDDETLEDFTKGDKILPVQELVGMCENTFNTLLPVSAGLLQARKFAKPYHRTKPSESDLEVIEWNCMIVEFMHRTAIDFLDSDEGINLFGKYALDDGILLSVTIKAELVLRSATAYKLDPLGNIWATMQTDIGAAGEVKNDLLLLIHRHAMDKNRGLLRQEPHEGASQQHKFLFEAALHGFYGYVEDWLTSNGTVDEPATAFILLGCCHYRGVLDETPPVGRYKLIRDLLKRSTCYSEGRQECPAIFSASDKMMLAWRCFMIKELSTMKQGRRGKEDGLWIEEILASFINAGVMAESPPPRFLISVGFFFDVLHGHGNNGDPQWGSVIYAEVNDAYLLQAVLNVPGETSKLISAAGSDAFMRPVLGSNHRDKGGERRFFRLSSDESQREALETWMFQKFLVDATAPNCLEIMYIGAFSNVFGALKEIGYELPQVNRSYFCAYRRWFSSMRR